MIVLNLLFVLTFIVGYLGTKIFFITQLIPLPFEYFGILVGLGLASFVRAIGGLFMKKKLSILILLLMSSVSFCPILLADDASINARLDRVISGQEEILKKLEEVKEEVQIVKVRATR